MNPARTAAVVTPLLLVLGTAHLVLSRRDSLLVVTSGSMSPAMRAGDLVVSRTPARDETTRLAPGTVVTFRTAHSTVLVTHRVVRTTTNASGRPVIITKGDANRAEDLSPVRPGDIVGITSGVVPRAGYAVAALRSRIFLLALAASTALAHLSVTLVRSARRATTHKHREEPVT